MLRIGICDDSAEAWQHMLQLCQKYYENNTDAFEYKMYKNAEEVLEYCDDEENQKNRYTFSGYRDGWSQRN